MVKLIIISTMLLWVLFPILGWLGMHSKRKKEKNSGMMNTVMTDGRIQRISNS